MSADPEDVAAVERDKCPDCGLPNGGHLGDCLIGGHQAMEIAALKKRLTEAETLLSDLRFDICTTFNPGNILIKRVKEISIFFNPPNPADDSDNCLACMGATGSAIRHTCKK